MDANFMPERLWILHQHAIRTRTATLERLAALVSLEENKRLEGHDRLVELERETLKRNEIDCNGYETFNKQCKEIKKYENEHLAKLGK